MSLDLGSLAGSGERRAFSALPVSRRWPAVANLRVLWHLWSKWTIYGTAPNKWAPWRKFFYRTANVSRKRLAEKMHTSRSQVSRVLDPKDGNVTLETRMRAAKIVGR
jgi:hypothetical protein